MTAQAKIDRSWTRTEVAAIVADYRAMVLAELRGERFNKRARNTALQEKTGRSGPSIEFKHRNISAVLHDLSLRFIRGYKPAVNYQQLLADEVLAWLIAAPAEAALLAEPATISAQIHEPPSFEAGTAPIENAVVRRRQVRLRGARRGQSGAWPPGRRIRLRVRAQTPSRCRLLRPFTPGAVGVPGGRRWRWL